MTLDPTPSGGIMRLSSSEIRTAYWCLAAMIRSRRHDVPRPVADLFNRLDTEFHRMSQPRHETNDDTGDPAQLRKWIGTSEAAALLGLQDRTIQRNAETLGGAKVSGVLVFDRATVIAHKDRLADA
jgi:hypothetical protein